LSSAVRLVDVTAASSINHVTQTILHDPDRPQVPGNCLQAAVASVLALPLDAVPNFATFLWWPQAMKFWARGRMLVVRNEQTATIPERLCVVGGKSPRGVDHACVAEAGRIVWDPHPSRAGLVSVDEVWWFEPWRHDGSEGCWACGKPQEVSPPTEVGMPGRRTNRTGRTVGP
jgi:hypothetical protein